MHWLALMRGASEGQPESAPGGSDRKLRFVSVLLVLAATVILLFSGAFEPLEHRLTTIRAQLLDRPPTGEVAIVEIDAKSLAEISTWPWSRRYHAQALRKLHSSGAVIVGFDVDFSSLSETAGDREFAEALFKAQPEGGARTRRRPLHASTRVDNIPHRSTLIVESKHIAQ